MFKERSFRLYDGPGVIAGVCAGLAYYLGMPIWLVRLVLLLLFIFGAGGLLIYVILWIAVPRGPTPRNFCEVTS